MAKPLHVVVGFHSWGMVTAKFTTSLLRASQYEGTKLAGVLDVCSPYTDEARNNIVRTFLDGCDADYLLMIDADIEFGKSDISRTMTVAEVYQADVVWGNYALGDFKNSIFEKDLDTEFGAVLTDLKPNTIYPNIYCGGTGWCLMHRGVLLKMRDTFSGPWHWFARDISPNKEGVPTVLGEDVTFGKRAHSLGAKQVGYTGVTLIHHKVNSSIPPFMKGSFNKGPWKVVDGAGQQIETEHIPDVLIANQVAEAS